MSRVVEVDCWCPIRHMDIIKEAADIIKSGGLVVAPTDTLYGILADPFNPEAVERVYRVKGRPRGKPLPLLLAESHHALKVVEPGEAFWRLANEHWPGPLTIIEKAREGLPKHLAAWGPIGVRLPNCPITREIARRVGGVVVGTSANKSGRESPNTVYIAYTQLGDSVDLYIDGGPSPLGRPSTVVSAREGRIEVVREGALPAGKILGTSTG